MLEVKGYLQKNEQRIPNQRQCYCEANIFQWHWCLIQIFSNIYYILLKYAPLVHVSIFISQNNDRIRRIICFHLTLLPSENSIFKKRTYLTLWSNKLWRKLFESRTCPEETKPENSHGHFHSIYDLLSEPLTILDHLQCLLSFSNPSPNEISRIFSFLYNDYTHNGPRILYSGYFQGKFISICMFQ